MKQFSSRLSLVLACSLFAALLHEPAAALQATDVTPPAPFPVRSDLRTELRKLSLSAKQTAKASPVSRAASPLKALRVAAKRTGKTGGAAEAAGVKPAAGFAGRLQRQFAAVDASLATTPSLSRQAGFAPYQRSRMESLRTEAKNPAGMKVALHRNGAVAHLSGADLSAPMPLAYAQPSPADVIGRIFLQKNRDLLRLADPGSELELVKSEKDATGATRLRYRQLHYGVPVWGKEASLHLKGDGAITLFQGHYLPTSARSEMDPKVPAAEALAVAQSELGVSASLQPVRQQLVLFSNERTGKDHLSWHFEVSPTPDKRWQIFIDAADGSVIHRYNDVHHGVVTARGTDLSGDAQSFTAWQEGSTYYMVDVTRPLDDRTTANPAADLGKSGDIIVFTAGNTSGDALNLNIVSSNSASSGWDTTGVTALTNVYKVLDYFKNTHGMNSFDGSTATVPLIVHYDTNLGNAFWNGKALFFGDGDGQTFGNLSRSLDVMAHEYAHAVTSNTANLKYEGQSGALNEAFSDIFGVMVDRDDWNVGEDATVNGSILRSLQDPHQGLSEQPAKMSEYYNWPLDEEHDNGGVHYNSGIPNRAAYLLAEGLTAEGLGSSIGKNKMEKIAFRALATYLHQESTFLDTRRAFVSAAGDLYGAGSAEVQAVTKAWDAVEVYDTSSSTPTSTTPTSTDPVSGESRLVYVLSGNIYLKTTNATYGPLNDEAARDGRPAVAVDAEGTYILYVTESGHTLRMITVTASTSADELVLGGGSDWGFWSVAVSPDGSSFAFTKDFEEPYLHRIDLTSASPSIQSFLLSSGSMDGGDASPVTVVAPDALSFDFTGSYVLYDALNQLVDKTTNAVYDYWSVGTVEVKTGANTELIPAQDSSWNVYNPMFASNNSHVLAFDFYNAADNTSAAIIVNANAQTAGEIISYPGVQQSAPAFWGDDGSVAIQAPGGIYRVTLDAAAKEADGVWKADGSAPALISSTHGSFPVPYNNGIRTIAPELSASPASINCGQINREVVKKVPLTITNTGNVDLTITDITATGNGFSHNGINGLLPKGSSVQIEVACTAGQTQQVMSGSLTLSYDPGSAAVTVPLSASATGVAPGGDITGDGSVTINDALSTLQYALNLVPRTTETQTRYLQTADVYPLNSSGKPMGDGAINVLDALLLVQRSVGLLSW